MAQPHYKFPPMLGPASAHPVGSREWAECLGNELDYRAERAVVNGVTDFLAVVDKAMAAEIPPWTVWPDPPCGSADAYFRLCTGLSLKQISVLRETFAEPG